MLCYDVLMTWALLGEERREWVLGDPVGDVCSFACFFLRQIERGFHSSVSMSTEYIPTTENSVLYIYLL